MKFRFLFHGPSLEMVDELTARVPHMDLEADSVEDAWAIVEPKIPEGMKLFCWYVLDKQQ